MSQIYFERQVAGLCAVHCINALLQGNFFTAMDLADIAREFDALERAQMLEHGADTPDAIKFLAEDSGNLAADGNFSVQVLEKALVPFGLELQRVPAATQQGRELLRQAAATQEAFIANQGEHWLTQRKIGDDWWNLNSLLDAPQHMSPFYVETYLHSLVDQGYDLFVVKGALPPANDQLEGAGVWFSAIRDVPGAPVPQLFDHNGNRVVAAPAKSRRAAATAANKRLLGAGFDAADSSSSDDGDGDLRRAIAASKRSAPSQAAAADDDDDDLKRALAESRQSAPSSKPAAANVADDDEDAVLKAALALSMQQ